MADHVTDLFKEGGRPITLIQAISGPSHLLIENVADPARSAGKGIGGSLLKRAE